MLRKIAITLIPSVVLLSIVTLVVIRQTPRKNGRSAVTGGKVMQHVGRSGYIVASS